MSDPSAQIDNPNSDVTAARSPEEQSKTPKHEAGQADASVQVEANQPEATLPQLEGQPSEKQTEPPSSANADEVTNDTAPVVDTDIADPSLTANSETTLGTTSGDPNPVDPILGVSEPVKTEDHDTAEMGQSSSTLAAGFAEENEKQNGHPGLGERSRSESTGGVSVRSGGSSASALPENVPRVGGVRCCKFAFSVTIRWYVLLIRFKR